jgi:hypothetical protein
MSLKVKFLFKKLIKNEPRLRLANVVSEGTPVDDLIQSMLKSLRTPNIRQMALLIEFSSLDKSLSESSTASNA